MAIGIAGPPAFARAGDEVPRRVGSGANDQGLSRRHILDACEASLRRLKTDTIDLYQSHSHDPETPLDESLRAFDDLVRSGKVRYVGCSNYAAWQLALPWGSASAAARRGTTACSRGSTSCTATSRPNAAALPRPGGRRDRLQPAGGRLPDRQAFRRRAAGAGTRFTMAHSGELYRERYWHAAQFEAVEALKAFCQRRGWDLATASVAWVLQQPGITSAIVGASRPEQLDATLAAPDLTFDDEARAASTLSGGPSRAGRRSGDSARGERVTVHESRVTNAKRV